MRFVLVSLALSVAVAPLGATEMSAFLAAAFGAPAPKGGAICFARVYDRAHLAAHPGQRISDVAIKLSLRSNGAETRLDHNLATHFKGARQLYWSGGACTRFSGLVAECFVEGDGGAATFTLSADGATLTARFEDFNVWRPQDAADETEMTIDRSKADKVARLDRAPMAACKDAGE